MSTFIFQGHKIWYKITGEGKTPMLFLHNGGNDHRIWDYQVKRFSGKYRIYLMDLLGYGQSDKPDIEYSLDLYTDILSGFIDEIISGPVILAGNCIGAAQALAYAQRLPEKVKALVLFNIASEKNLAKGIFGILYKMSKKNIIRTFVTSLSKMKMTIGLAKRITFNRLYGKTGEPAESRDEFRNHVRYLYSDARNLRVLYNLLNNFSNFGQIDNFSISEKFPPCLIIWGEQNVILPSSGGKELCEKMNTSQAHFLKDCGHMVMREKHGNVNMLIEDFLQ